MSGAAGHLLHLYENRSLKFSELIDVLTRAAQAQLEHVTEKFDGVNIVFTWDDEQNDLRVARNGSDIAGGGIDFHELAKRFSGRGNVLQAFEQAFQVLRQSISALSRKDLLNVFDAGRGRQFWYSAEIVYPSGANTINYDCNCIVFHGYPIFRSGLQTERVADSSGLEILKSRIDAMREAINLRGWRVSGPAFVQLKNVVNSGVLRQATDRISAALAQTGLTMDATIRDYLQAMAHDRCRMMGINDYVAKLIALRLINDPIAPNVTRLVKMSPGHAKKIADLVSRDKQLIADFIQPIELAISDFACQMMKGMHSMLVNDGNMEVQRLRNQVNDAIEAIRETGDIDLILKMEKQLLKLSNVDNITSSMEGVVFFYRGQAYKLTGAWAPAHQILSLYQRARKNEQTV